MLHWHLVSKVLVVLWLLVVLLLLHWHLLLLGHKHSLLGLRVKHSVAFNVAQVAHIALLSERVVVVEASLTCPISNVVLGFHAVFLGHSVVEMNSVFWLGLVDAILAS